MAKKARARAERRRAARAQSRPEAAAPASRPAKPPRRARNHSVSARRRGLPLATIAWSIGGIAAVGLLVLALAGAGGAREADAATEQLARDNAGTAVTVHGGSAHVVYHSDPPLPSAAAPRADGQPTLVWFSGTWCHVCEQMAPFAHQTASTFRGRMVFVEKSVDHDRGSSSRFGIRGTPTFVMLDASGTEVIRFHGSPDAVSFAAAIERALAALG